MADGVAITAGSGTTVATDDVAGVHYQRVKLVNGTLDATDAIGGDATNGLDVDVTRVIPGTGATALGKAEDAAHTDGDTGVMALAVRNSAGPGADGDYGALSLNALGDLRVDPRPNLLRVQVTSGGLTTSVTAYSAGDQLGTQFTIANAALASGGSGYIVGVNVLDETDIIGALDVAFHEASVTPAADNAAFSLSDADGLLTCQVVPLATTDLGLNRLASSGPLRIPYTCNGGTSLYANIITRSGHTFFGATTSLKLVVYLERVS
jgi:hypothetical protein